MLCWWITHLRGNPPSIVFNRSGANRGAAQR